MLRDVGDSGVGAAAQAGLIDRERGIISDSKSGVSGAGKEPTSRTHFVSVADNFSAYSVFNHRHTGEMVEQLRLNAEELIFTPHLLPIPRGILSTIYVNLKHETTAEKSKNALETFTPASAGCVSIRRRNYQRFSSRCTRTIAISVSRWRKMGVG